MRRISAKAVIGNRDTGLSVSYLKKKKSSIKNIIIYKKKYNFYKNIFFYKLYLKLKSKFLDSYV